MKKKKLINWHLFFYLHISSEECSDVAEEPGGDDRVRRETERRRASGTMNEVYVNKKKCPINYFFFRNVGTH